jgi:hypothetical protein
LSRYIASSSSAHPLQLAGKKMLTKTFVKKTAQPLPKTKTKPTKTKSGCVRLGRWQNEAGACA